MLRSIQRLQLPVFGVTQVISKVGEIVFSHISRFSVYPKSNTQTKSNIAENIDFLFQTISFYYVFLPIRLRIYLIHSQNTINQLEAYGTWTQN